MGLWLEVLHSKCNTLIAGNCSNQLTVATTLSNHSQTICPCRCPLHKVNFPPSPKSWNPHSPNTSLKSYICLTSRNLPPNFSCARVISLKSLVQSHGIECLSFSLSCLRNMVVLYIWLLIEPRKPPFILLPLINNCIDMIWGIRISCKIKIKLPKNYHISSSTYPWNLQHACIFNSWLYFF